MNPDTGDNFGCGARTGRDTSRHAGGGRRGPAAIVLIAALTSPAEANALWGDRLGFFVGQARTWDSNIYRISANSDPVALLGTSSKGDVYDTTSVGLKFDIPVNRQRLLGGIDWNQQRYEHFTVLNFTSRHERALWQWQAGSDLNGELGITRARELASLANVQSGVQSSTPNALEMRRTHLNATYWLTPRWKMRGEVSRMDHANDLPVFQVNDIRLDSIDVAASYVTPAGSVAGLGLRFMNGDLPMRQVVSGNLVDNSYRQNGVDLLGEWSPTGKSRVGARLGWISRNYGQLPERDYSGYAINIRYDWQATGKINVAAIAQRDISTTEQVNVGFVLVKGIALQPSFQVTEKINLAGALEYSDREYLGDPGLVLGTVAARTDTVRGTSIRVSWQPLRPLSLGMDWRRETRASTAVAGDYAVDVLTLRLRIEL